MDLNNYIFDPIKVYQQSEANKALIINSYKKDIDESLIEIINKYKEEIQKYNCGDITNLILDYAQYEKICTINSYGYKLFGKKEGKCITLYENGNGNKLYKGEFKNGKEESNWITWYENGNKYLEGECKNRIKEGKWITWYENENKQHEREFKNGKIEGKWISWYYNGNKSYEAEYKNDKKEGKWFAWYENGNIEYIREYKNGSIYLNFVN